YDPATDDCRRALRTGLVGLTRDLPQRAFTLLRRPSSGSSSGIGELDHISWTTRRGGIWRGPGSPGKTLVGVPRRAAAQDAGGVLPSDFWCTNLKGGFVPTLGRGGG